MTDFSGYLWPDEVVLFARPRFSRGRAVLLDGSTAVITPDITAPTISALTPTSVLRDTPVSFQVTDVGGLRKVIVTAQFGGGDTVEVVHNGTTFTGNYAGYSGRWTVTGGYGFSILREHGWPSSPTIEVFSVDTSGNVTET